MSVTIQHGVKEPHIAHLQRFLNDFKHMEWFTCLNYIPPLGEKKFKDMKSIWGVLQKAEGQKSKFPSFR